MQDLINLSLAEMRREEHTWAMRKVNAEGWKTVRGWSGREAVAKMLVNLAARIAPTVTTPMPSANSRALAQ